MRKTLQVLNHKKNGSVNHAKRKAAEIAPTSTGYHIGFDIANIWSQGACSRTGDIASVSFQEVGVLDTNLGLLIEIG